MLIVGMLMPFSVSNTPSDTLVGPMPRLSWHAQPFAVVVTLRPPPRSLRPRAVVDGVLVRGAGHCHVPLHRPGVRVLEALARIRLRSRMQKTPGRQLVR